ncbi:MAG: hypothetical protein GX060_09215 [Firmicutes bacterium]|nr:hypothetical protein [Bacillota bacterium]
MLNNSQRVLDGQSMTTIWGRLGNNRFLLVGLIGVVALLAIQLLWPGQPATMPIPNATPVGGQVQSGDAILEQITAYRQSLEEQLAELLSGIQGVGEVRVMLSLASGPEIVPAMSVQTSQRTTEEKDSNGGTRVIQEDSKSSNLLTNSSNQMMRIQEKLPPINGVVIVAQGADRADVRLELTRAVQTICNVPAHLVQVLPGK